MPAGKDSGLLYVIKNAAVVVVFMFLKHNGLFGRLADSNHFYTEESFACTESAKAWIIKTKSFEE